MSEAIAFDTHRFVKNLTANGFTEVQAEALAEEQAHLLESNLATKADIRATKADIQGVKADLEIKIEKTRADILKWMIGATTAHAALIAGLVWNLFTRLPGVN